MRKARLNGKWLHDSSEYKIVRTGKRITRAHILIMEAIYGRPLILHLGLYGHHKDKNPQNNLPENIKPVTPKEHYEISRRAT